MLKCHKRGLTWEQVCSIRERAARGAQQIDLAAEHGISQAAIWCILERRTYKYSPVELEIQRVERERLAKLRRISNERGIPMEDVLRIAGATCCEVCGATDDLVTDHDHKTGRGRGALCHNCNVGLGHFKDDIAIVEKALEYLRKWKGILKCLTP